MRKLLLLATLAAAPVTAIEYGTMFDLPVEWEDKTVIDEFTEEETSTLSVTSTTSSARLVVRCNKTTGDKAVYIHWNEFVHSGLNVDDPAAAKTIREDWFGAVPATQYNGGPTNVQMRIRGEPLVRVSSTSSAYRTSSFVKGVEKSKALIESFKGKGVLIARAKKDDRRRQWTKTATFNLDSFPATYSEYCTI